MSESDYEYLDKLYEQIDELQSQVVSLNKALDKACEVLENDYGRFIVPDDERLFWKAEQWKEWCMSDENN